MAITMRELHRSRTLEVQLRSGGLTLEFIVLGSIDEDDVYAYVRTNTPGYYGPVAGISRLQRQKIVVAPQGGGVWFATITYGTPESPEVPGAPTPTDPLGIDWSFDTTGQTQHVTQSKHTTQKIKRGGGAADDLEGAIGVSKDGVQGTDVVVPKLEFSISRSYFFLTPEYLKKVSDLTGTVNDAEFFGFARGEVLFLGGSGQGSTGDFPRLTFRFARSKNRENIYINDEIEIPEKKGWEYLWVAYEDAVGASSVISRPRAAYVEEVYDLADFTQLGI